MIKSLQIQRTYKNISEFNIGHFLIAESIFIGLKKAIIRFKKLIKV